MQKPEVKSDLPDITVVGRVMDSPKTTVSYSLESVCKVMWQRRIKVANGIKFANQLTLKWGDYPGLFGWVHCNHRGACTWKKEAQEC